MNTMNTINTMTATSPPVAPASASGSRSTILMLAALFLLPVALGTGLFWSGWRPSSFSNYGELIQPPVQLPESGLLQANGHPMPRSALLGQWLIVLPSTTACAEQCEDLLQQIRQVHIALNKEQSRVQRVFLRLGEIAQTETAGLKQLEQRFPQLILASAPTGAASDRWHHLFASNDASIFIVDPQGNVMMRYDNVSTMRGVLKDLERLLKYSWTLQTKG